MKNYRLFCLVITIFLLSYSIDSYTQTEDPLTAVVEVVPTVITPGQTAELKITMQLPESYHAYLDKFDIQKIEPETIKLGALNIHPTVEFFDKTSNKNRTGVEKKSYLVTTLDVPGDFSRSKVDLNFELVYQACTDQFCLFPTKKKLNIHFNVEQKNKVNLDPVDDGVLSTSFDQAYKKGFLFTLLFVFVAGILTSLTPCVFPMIPITIAVLNRSAHQKNRFMHFMVSNFYVLGIATTYSSLGIFAAYTGALFGQFIGHPAVQGTMAFIFLAMAFSLFGFFELQVPSFLQNFMQKYHTEKGLRGAFVSGLVAGIVASPCVGPVLVAILTHVARTQDLFLGFILLFVYAIGMGQLFLVLGLTNQFKYLLPKSGPWMNNIKKIMAIAMLLFSFYYAKQALPQKWFVKEKNSTQEQNEISYWKEFSYERMQEAARSKTPVIIDFHASWCAACLELELKTFSDSMVKEAGKQFVMLKFDATDSSVILEELQNKFSIVGLPTILFFSKKGTWLQNLTLTGFEEAPEFHSRMLKALASED